MTLRYRYIFGNFTARRMAARSFIDVCMYVPPNSHVAGDYDKLHRLPKTMHQDNARVCKVLAAIGLSSVHTFSMHAD